MKKLFSLFFGLILSCSIFAAANPILPNAGGTGVSNSNSNTVTLGGAFSTQGALSLLGAHNLTLNIATSSNVNVPSSGNLLTDTGSYSNPSWIASVDGSKITGTNTANAITPGTYAINITGTAGGGSPPTGTAGGDLSSSYPNPTVAKVNGVSLGSTTATSGNLLIGSGTAWVSNSVSGDATLSSGGALTFDTVNLSPGTYGTGTQVASITVNGKGLVTSASNISITGAPPSGSAGGDLSGTYPTPTVSQINGSPLGTISASTPGNILVAQGGHWNSQAMGGDATIGGGGALSLATVNSSPGTYGDSSHSLTANVNGKGLVTSLSTNSIQIAESQVTNLTTDLAAKLALAGGTMSGNLILNADPTSSAQAATKNYVDMTAAGLQIKTAVGAATTANLVGTYNNGASGVGATLTMTATGVLTLDGQTVILGNRYLIKNQTSGFQNGVYDCTTAGAVGVAAVFTRSADYNTAADMDAGSLIPIINGTTWGGTTWLQTATVTTVGTDSLVFSEFGSGPTTLTGDVSGSGFSPTSTTVVAINSNPLGSTAPTNGNILKANGTQWATAAPAALTSANDTNVTLTLGGSSSTALLNAASITAGWAGQLAETRGGTNQSTYALGDLLYASAANTLSKLAGNTTSTRKFLRQTGTGTISAAPAWDTITAADVPASALTASNDANITLTLGGSPSTALLNATSITAGWAGTLAAGRLNSNVVQGVTNDTNVTGSISAQNLTLGWTGVLSAARLNFNTTNLKNSSGALNTSQDLATVSSPTFYNETLTGTGVIQQTIQSTTTGATNYANLVLMRGDNPNGYNLIQLGTGGTGEWNIAEYAASTQLKFHDSTNNVDQIQVNQGSGTSGSVVVAGSLSSNAMNVANLTASSLVATDGSKNLTSSVSGLSPQFLGLTVSSGAPSVSITATSTGSTLNLSRFVNTQAANLIYLTNGTQDWALQDSGSSPTFGIKDLANGVTQLSVTQGSGTSGSVAVTGSLTVGNDVTINSGNSIINTAGKTLKIKEGSNACAGTGAVMSGGAVTVSTTCAATGDIVFLMKTASGGTSGSGMPVVTISNGVSFTITGGASDTSTWSWVIIKGA